MRAALEFPTWRDQLPWREKLGAAGVGLRDPDITVTVDTVAVRDDGGTVITNHAGGGATGTDTPLLLPGVNTLFRGETYRVRAVNRREQLLCAIACIQPGTDQCSVGAAGETRKGSA